MASNYRDCVVLLGDSLTCGQAVPNNLVARFNAVYYDTLDVLNRGVDGYNTSWYLPLMKRIFIKHDGSSNVSNVRLVTIWFGANDAHSPLNAPRWGVTPETFGKNLNIVIDLLVSPTSPFAIAHSSTPLSIILITPPCVHSPMLDDPEKLDNQRIRLYRDIVLRVGAQWQERHNGRWQVATIDLFDALHVAAKTQKDPSVLYTDGLHLSTLGYDVLWTEIERLIKTDFKGRGIDWEDENDLARSAPTWKQRLEGTKQEER